MSEADRDARDDAFELFVTEAARTRLLDRVGQARVVLASGAVLAGTFSTVRDDAVDRHLSLVDATGHLLLVSIDAIVMIHGSAAALREEFVGERARSLASVLRELWTSGSRLRLLLRNGESIDGAITLVGSDYVEMTVAGQMCVVPFSAVAVWNLRSVN